MAEALFAGIDVGGDRLHAVMLNERGEIADVRVSRMFPRIGEYFFEFIDSLEPARVIAMDAPLAPSTSPHANDTTLSPKFRAARCGEIALGRSKRIWVPWVAAPSFGMTGWMDNGFYIAETLGSAGARVVETYPHAVFRLLAGGRLARKSTTGGMLERVQVLREIRQRPRDIEMWSHDAIDALVAAEVAFGVDSGWAEAITCGHDGSAIWVPRV